MINLTTEEKLFVEKFEDRFGQMKAAKQNVFGVDIEKVWEKADQKYVPHRLSTKGKKVIYSDDELGLRGRLIELGADNWQHDEALAFPYAKVQVALSILIDRNPGAIFEPSSEKYISTTPLMENLYYRNWEITKSRRKVLVPYVFDLAKYGFACGRTFPKIDKKGNIEIIRENLDVFNIWLDEATKPYDKESMRDWCWRIVYPYDVFQKIFKNNPKAKYIKDILPNTGDLHPRLNSSSKQVNIPIKNGVEVYFYENQLEEEGEFAALVEGKTPIILTDLPYDHKTLSCWFSLWTLRHSRTPYGLGMMEVMEANGLTLDKIRNMTLDQLVLSIYKMFFYTGTDQIDEDGKIKIEPGVGKQVIDPKNITWLDIKGPGAEAWKGIDVLKDEQAKITGITPQLEGIVETGKTAFEIAQAKEGALKRLKTPLDNIVDALEEDAMLTVKLISQIYSVPKVRTLSDPDEIESYLEEIKGDISRYEINEKGFQTNEYKEVSLRVDRDEEGNYTETDKEKFFKLKPSDLGWDGIIRIKGQSLLSVSKELQKQMDLEFVNVLVPLLAGDPNITKKPAIQLCEIYDKNPKRWLPDIWFQQPSPQELITKQQPPQDLIINQPGQPQGQPFEGGQGFEPTREKSIAKQFLAKINPFHNFSGK